MAQNQVLPFEDIPLNQDCYLVSEKYLDGFAEAIDKISKGDINIYPNVGSVERWSHLFEQLKAYL